MRHSNSDTRSALATLRSDAAPVRWRKDGLGRWTAAIGTRGQRVRIIQREPGGSFLLTVWVPGTGYRTRSLRTRDRARAQESGLAASRAKARGYDGRNVRGVDGASVRAQTMRTPAGPRTLTLADLWQRFSTKSGMFLDNSRRTQEDARMRAAVLLAYFGSDFDVGRLDEDFQYLYVHARRRGGISYVGRDGMSRVTGATGPRSAEADLDLLRMMLAWATRSRSLDGGRVLTANPLCDARRPRGPRARRRPVATQQRYHATMVAMIRLEEEAADADARVRWWKMQLALRLAEATGRRIGAIRLLRWEDVEFAEGTIRWRAEADKRGHELVVPVPGELLADILAYGCHIRDCVPAEAPSEGFLMPAAENAERAMDRHLFDHWLRIAEAVAGLPKLEGGLWHPYRRKWASERKHHPLADLAAAGGWVDTPTLITCYTQPDPATMLKVMREPLRMSEPLG